MYDRKRNFSRMKIFCVIIRKHSGHRNLKINPRIHLTFIFFREFRSADLSKALRLFRFMRLLMLADSENFKNIPTQNFVLRPVKRVGCSDIKIAPVSHPNCHIIIIKSQERKIANVRTCSLFFITTLYLSDLQVTEAILVGTKS